jgi:transposase, IS5 family
MLRDRYDPMDLFEYIPALGMETDAVLTQLDTLLDDDVLFQAIKQDLSRRFPRTSSFGRPSTPVEVILRLIVVKHLYDWSYEQTEQSVADSLVLRQFCRIYAEKVPDDTTLIRWANLIQPKTLHALLDHITDCARHLKVTRGRKLRIDGTVVETNIHYPVDSTLLGDGVRVLTRTIHRAKTVIGEGTTRARTLFRDRTRSVRRVLKGLIDAARRRGEHAQQLLQDGYRQLLELTEQVVDQAQQIQHLLQQQTDARAQRLHQTLQTFIPRVQQVIAQTTRRVIQGEAVGAEDKIVSLFEPHTAIIRKGKVGKPTEFGRYVWLDEVEGGIISRYAVLSGNPDDATQLLPSLDHHIEQFGRPPNLLAGDGKLATPSNERLAQQRGVRHVVLPRPGRKTPARQAHERQKWFRKGRNWRAGIEGRISGLKRRHGLDCCRDHGEDGMERWVGWGLIAHDLRMIAAHQADRAAQRVSQHHWSAPQPMARAA